jgi:preprotein translocase subunit YajC
VDFSFLIFLAAMLTILWLLLIRPQRRRQAAHAQLLSRLEVGDEVLTAGGVYGRVTRVGDEDLTLEIAPGTSVRVDRRAVASVVPSEAASEAEQPAETAERH